MEYFCLRCPHRWENRGGDPSRQCPACWSRSIASREELRLGRLFLRPWAYVARGQAPPLPPLQEAPLLLVAPLTYHSVMLRTRSAAERQRAAGLMLEEDGFLPAEASRLAAQMFPEG